MSISRSRIIPVGLGVAALASLAVFGGFARGIGDDVRRLAREAVSGGEEAVSTACGASATPPAAPAAPRALVRSEGRVVAYPGAEATVGVEVMGTLTRVLFVERSAVRRGGLLAEMASDLERAAVAEAEALLLEREADARFAANEQERAIRSRRESVVSEQVVDAARRDREVADARVALSRAGLERARAALAKTRVLSPIDGVVISRHADPGETLAPGAAVATVADLARVRVEAEVDEFDASRVAVGAAVVIEAEGDRGPALRGRVEEVPDAVLPRRLAPSDPGRPTDTRVLRVKVALDAPPPWKLGQRVEVAIECAP